MNAAHRKKMLERKEGEKLRAPSTVWLKPAFEQLIVLIGWEKC